MPIFADLSKLFNITAKIIPADLKELKLNHSKYSFLLNDKGGVIDDLIITKRSKGFLIILNAAKNTRKKNCWNHIKIWEFPYNHY